MVEFSEKGHGAASVRKGDDWRAGHVTRDEERYKGLLIELCEVEAVNCLRKRWPGDEDENYKEAKLQSSDAHVTMQVRERKS